MSELPQRAAYAIVFGIVVWVLDRVPATDGGGMVIGIGFIGGEIDFSEELLLVVFEFAD